MKYLAPYKLFEGHDAIKSDLTIDDLIYRELVNDLIIKVSDSLQDIFDDYLITQVDYKDVIVGQWGRLTISNKSEELFPVWAYGGYTYHYNDNKNICLRNIIIIDIPYYLFNVIEKRLSEIKPVIESRIDNNIRLSFYYNNNMITISITRVSEENRSSIDSKYQ